MVPVLDLVRAGVAALQRRDLVQARGWMERALAVAPEHAEAWNILGVARVTAGDVRGAEGAFRHAVDGAPGNPAYPRGLAETLRRQGRPAEARGVLADAVRRGALTPDLACDLADLTLALSGARAARAPYRLALLLAPDHARTLNNMAEASRRPDSGAEAREVVAAFRRLAALRATAAARAGLAGALSEAGRPEEAEAEARAAHRAQPDEPAAPEALGAALIQMGRHGEAAAFLRRAATLDPGRAGVWGNLGFAHLHRHAAEAAESAFARAVRILPDLAEAHVGLGSARLLAGRLREGAASYEWRLRLPQFQSPRRFDRPAWDGRIRPGATLLIHADRGLGDAIQFIRYAPLLRQAGMRVVFHGQAPLLGLFRASGLVDEAHDIDGPAPAHDVHANVLSLIHLMGTDLAGIPAAVPYLRAPEEARHRWAGRLSAVPGPKVGLVWAGSAQFLYDRQRSPRLAPLLPLLAVPGVSVVGLQVGHGRQDLEGAAACAMTARMIDLGPEIRDFADTAAVVEGLDLVVSSCTAVAHLAGALGRPVAVLLDHGSEWRWMRERRDSPWYPTARLYRQPSPGDWATPVAELCRDVEALGERPKP